MVSVDTQMKIRLQRLRGRTRLSKSHSFPAVCGMMPAFESSMKGAVIGGPVEIYKVTEEMKYIL